MERADTTYTDAMRAVHRARHRIGCDYIILTVRGGRASVGLAVPRIGGPGTYTCRVLFADADAPHRMVPLLDALTPATVSSALACAAAACHSAEQHEAFSAAIVAYHRRLLVIGEAA